MIGGLLPVSIQQGPGHDEDYSRVVQLIILYICVLCKAPLTRCGTGTSVSFEKEKKACGGREEEGTKTTCNG